MSARWAGVLAFEAPALIRRSTWKRNSANFACSEFSEVASKALIHQAMWKKSTWKTTKPEGGQRMDREPVVVQESTRKWETWPAEDMAERGSVYWKTLVSGDLTHSEALTMGIAKIPPDEALHEHRHRQAEIYLVLEGTGSVTIDGKNAARRSGVRGLHTGQRPALLRECGDVGAAVRICFGS